MGYLKEVIDIYNPIKEFKERPVYNTIVTGLGAAAIGLSVIASQRVNQLADDYVASVEMERNMQTILWLDSKADQQNTQIMEAQMQLAETLTDKLVEASHVIQAQREQLENQ